MHIQETVLPQARRLRMAPVLSPEARRRLRWIEYYLAHGRNIAQTCRHFDISRPTFYRWWQRYDPRHLGNLEDDRRTRRPARVRQPQTPPTLTSRIRVLRETYPRWGDRKLATLLPRAGWTVSHATVGRVLGRLRAIGQLHEPPLVREALHKQRRRARLTRRYAQRMPWGYLPRRRGDLVQLDTTPITLYPGCQRVHVTARDVVSRTDVVAAYKQGNSSAAEHFVRCELPRMGFPIRAIQIDGGSDFKANFERACQALGIQLFVLPPRSPRLNGKVERAQRTHQEEFYDLVEVPEDLVEHNRLLRAHETIYNAVRPHQALGYLTPNEFVARGHGNHRSITDKEAKCNASIEAVQLVDTLQSRCYNVPVLAPGSEPGPGDCMEWGTMTQPTEAVERLRAAEFRAVGSNQTAKAIGKGRAQVVFVATDADRRVIEGVVAAARDRGLEVIEVASMRELGRACGIAVGASAAAILSSP